MSIMKCTECSRDIDTDYIDGTCLMDKYFICVNCWGSQKGLYQVWDIVEDMQARIEAKDTDLRYLKEMVRCVLPTITDDYARGVLVRSLEWLKLSRDERLGKISQNVGAA